MLKMFEVKGFKNFNKDVSLDFSDVKQYNFNKFCIKNNLLKNGIIYGKNAIGKTNLGLAIFDITTHLVDRNIGQDLYEHYLTNDGITQYAKFKYTFQFNQHIVIYTYHKSDVNTILFENLIIDEYEIFNYDSSSSNSKLISINDKFASYIPNPHFHEGETSFLRYIILNSRTNIDNTIAILSKLYDFVSNMLWFRSLEVNRFIGYKDPIKKASDYFEFIFESDNLLKFQKLISKAGIENKLVERLTPDNRKALYFDGNPVTPFFKVASNGTKALYTYFYWTRNKDISFLFIDEFDAYYHFELAELIVKDLESRNFQTLLTTHNTNLLSNNIMRPDCYFILSLSGLTSIARSTNRELREGHNLEKLFINGEFGGNK